MYIVPLKPVPAQSVAIVLSNQACIISLRQMGGRQYLSLSAGGVVMCEGVLLVNDSAIVRAPYLGFIGELSIVDTQGDDAPEYTGWGSRWLLSYSTD